MIIENADPCTRSKIEIPDGMFKGPNKILVPQLIQAVYGLEDYWAMSVRQIYYQAVAKLLVSNEINQYRRVQRLLGILREESLLPWECIEDRTRKTTDKRGVENLQIFLQENLESMLNWRYYHRCHVQGQGNYIELSVEKDALAPLVDDVGWRYCTRVNTTRGQTSKTMIETMATRFDAAMQHGQTPVLIHFGDLDPSGVAIPRAMQKTLWKVHGLDVEVVMGGLTPAQCSEYKLLVSPDSVKESDPNIRAWRKYYPDQAPTELDALHPTELTQLVEKILLEWYDEGQMDAQQAKERKEEDVLKDMRVKTLRFLRATYPEQLGGLKL